MNILTFVPVITSGAAWSGAGGQLRLGGCCHEAPALSVTSGGRGHPGAGDWADTTRPETEGRGGHLGGAQDHLCVIIRGHTRDRPHPDPLNRLY